jgi:hypothetical protein
MDKGVNCPHQDIAYTIGELAQAPLPEKYTRHQVVVFGAKSTPSESINAFLRFSHSLRYAFSGFDIAVVLHPDIRWERHPAALHASGPRSHRTPRLLLH